MILTSPAFQSGDYLPKSYTCDGENISPPLDFLEIPEGTESLVLIHNDPEAISGAWTHWVLFNLPPTSTGLEEDIKNLPEGAQYGTNSWGNIGYGGACPPDKEHLYQFKLYALNTLLTLERGASQQEVEQAMEGYIIESAFLTAPYKRPFH